MPNVRLIIEYDGAKFHGWQIQPNVKTAQEELHRVLEMILKEPIHEVIASGRTDAGVHAKRQVVNFHLKIAPDLNMLKKAVGSVLAGELTVIDVDIVPDDFHARYSAKSKEYRYIILNRDSPPVLELGKVWYIFSKLDVARMQEEANSLVGTHDFSSFQGSRCLATTPIKTIFRSDIISEPPYIHYVVEGQGFLKHMVRNIVGTLVAFGRKDPKFISMNEILLARDRRAAGITAPAHGLYLEKVMY